jgi:hypothetical protein
VLAILSFLELKAHARAAALTLAASRNYRKAVTEPHKELKDF